MARNEGRRVAEVVGALGVIGSLIFVGLEVRESSRATRAATDAEIAAQFVEINLAMYSSDHLAADKRLDSLLRSMNESGRFVGAVCAAPKVLVRNGILAGKQATAFPGVLQAEDHPDITGNAVTRDGRVITSRSAGTVMDFALAIIEALLGRDSRDTVEQSLARN